MHFITFNSLSKKSYHIQIIIIPPHIEDDGLVSLIVLASILNYIALLLCFKTHQPLLKD